MGKGPLTGLRIVEFTGLGPAPLAGQLLADLGAEVIAIDRASGPANPADVNRRGKQSVALNLKHPGGLDAAKRLISTADVLIEGFRPGVMEKLGLGPDALPDRLIYARMTGWGQSGPLAHSAGHDLTYLALTGALHMMGDADRPPSPPLNLVADYGGGTMFLIFGILAALFERQSSGKGQVIDAAMVDGVSAFLSLQSTMRATGFWNENRADNMLDGGAPYYRCYACADGKHIAVAPIEPQFFAELLTRAGLPAADAAIQNDKSQWPEMRDRYAALFATKTRDEWAEIFEGTDACVAPILTPDEAPAHPHMAARAVFEDRDGITHAAPAPRFSRNAPPAPGPVTAPGAQTDQLLRDAGLAPDAIDALRAEGALT